MVGKAWFVAPKRTPIGRFMGDLSNLTAPALAAHAIAATVRETQIDPPRIDEVIVGQVLPAGAGQAPARQAMHAAGLPDSTGAVSVNKVCGSGLYAVMLASRAIAAGEASAIVAGGMESMSQAPHLLRGGRSGLKYGTQMLLDAIEYDGLRCARSEQLMGGYADRVAAKHGISRELQDRWALASHQRALAAQERGDFQSELVPIAVHANLTVSKDAGPRADSSLEKLSKLKPAFHPDGTVTAGNASTLSDGAASVLVVSDAVRQEIPQLPAFRIVATATSSGLPEDLFVAPASAIRKVLAKSQLQLPQIDLLEINEAFASQTLACLQLLELDGDNVNVNGGAIALGHPIGCSGTRVLVTLAAALHARQLHRGIAALCLGGGEAVAILIEHQTA